MKKVISTIVAIGFISSMLVNTAYAGNRHVDVLNPRWVPVAILSTVAAIVQPPVFYERRGYSEPCQTVRYEEPARHYRQDHYYGRGRAYEEPRHYRQVRYYDRGRAYEEPRHYRQVRYYDRDRAYEEPRYREYR